jgi:hypothetical protein
MLKVRNDRLVGLLGLAAFAEALWEMTRVSARPIEPVVAGGLLSRISGLADAVIGATKTIFWTGLLTTAAVGSLELYRRHWRPGGEGAPLNNHVTVNITVNGEKVKPTAVAG